MLRSDNEPALVGLAEKIKMLAKETTEIVIETSPVTDKDANGAAERAVQAAEQQIRTMKVCLEDRVKCKIPIDHPIVTWMVRHAGDLITKYEVKRLTGQTGYEGIKGRPNRGEVTDFGRYDVQAPYEAGK